MPNQPGPAATGVPDIEGDHTGAGGATLSGALLAADVVHDLRNALTVVLGSLEQLRRQPLDAQGQQQLERAQWGAKHAGQLAGALLVSGLDQGRNGTPANAEVIDLNEAVMAFIATVGQPVDGGRAFVLDLASGPLPVRLNRGGLERALLNLVRNAADATAQDGQVTIRTVASSERQGADGRLTVEVAVSDTGTGMTPEAARRAGEAFFTTKGPEHGTGLGLWAVRRFVEYAGGTMTIETVFGQGTTITIILPRAAHSGPSAAPRPDAIGPPRSAAL